MLKMKKCSSCPLQVSHLCVAESLLCLFKRVLVSTLDLNSLMGVSAKVLQLEKPVATEAEEQFQSPLFIVLVFCLILSFPIFE